MVKKKDKYLSIKTTKISCDVIQAKAEEGDIEFIRKSDGYILIKRPITDNFISYCRGVISVDKFRGMYDSPSKKRA